MRFLFMGILLLTLVGCSSGSGTASKPNPPTPPANQPGEAVTEAPVPNQVLAGEDVTFSVDIANDTPLHSNLLAQAAPNKATRLGNPSAVTLTDFVFPEGFSRDESSTCAVGQVLQVGESCVLTMVADFDQPTVVDATLVVNTDAGPISKPVKFTVVTTPTASMPAPPRVNGYLSLIPGDTSRITITNPGLQEINTPRLVLPSFIKDVVTEKNITYADDLRGGASTTFTFKVPSSFSLTTAEKEQLSALDSNIVSVRSANTLPVNVPVQSFTGLSANAISFSEPGAQTITVHNNSDLAATLDIVDFSLPHGVTKDTDKTTCADDAVLAAGESCTIDLDASSSAYGDGNIIINYKAAGSSQTFNLQSEVNVASTSVSIENPISVKAGTQQSVTVTNTGKFDAQLNSSSVSLHANSSSQLDPATNSVTASGCSSVIAPDASCTVTLNAAANTTTAGDYDLQVQASNLAAQTQTFTVQQPQASLTVGTDDGWNDNGLASKRLIVSNDGEDNSSLTISVTKNNFSNDITESNDCSTLSAGKSCYITLKANNNQAVGTSNNDASIKVSGGGKTVTEDLDYQQDLYISGCYAEGRSGCVSEAARYNGADWSKVGGSFTGDVRSMAVNPVTGNVYAAGSFTNLLGSYYIAEYNGGAAWSEFSYGPDNSLFNSAIQVLHFDSNADLYTAGMFIDAASKHYVAKLHDGVWSNLGFTDNDGGYLYSLESFALAHNHVYVGGRFTNSARSGFIADYDLASNLWSSVMPDKPEGSTANFPYFETVGTTSGGNLVTTAMLYDAATRSYDTDVYQYDGSAWKNDGAPSIANALIAVPDSFKYDDAGNLYAFITVSTTRSRDRQRAVAEYHDGAWSLLGDLQSGSSDAAMQVSPTGQVYIGLYNMTDNSYDIYQYQAEDGTWLNIGAAPAGSEFNSYLSSAMVIAPSLTLHASR